MCNCSQKRTQYSSSTRPMHEMAMGMGQVQLLGSPPFTVTGDVTGREYSFSEPKQILWVDKRDMIYLRSEKGIRVLG